MVNPLVEKKLAELMDILKNQNITDRIDSLNGIKKQLFLCSPFPSEPVDCVIWVPADKVHANDYNPNSVAPPEMKLLELSIQSDGYTQPIVTFYDEKLDKYIVVDGFHRNLVGKNSKEINQRIQGHLPIVVIDKPIKERMASTVRHNRARGQHGIAPMSELVAKLYFNGWSNKRIATELGMEQDEVLRLKQFTGIGLLFKTRNYSNSWELNENNMAEKKK